MRPPREIAIGVDLGKLRDFTAISVIERFSTRAGRDPYWCHDVYEWTTTVRARTGCGWGRRIRVWWSGCAGWCCICRSRRR